MISAFRNLWRYAAALLLRYQIHETEAWIRACEADGILTGRSLEIVRRDLAVMRVKLALLQPRRESARGA